MSSVRLATVRNVRGTSHRNYQTDLQHLLSLVGKTSSNLSTTRSPFLLLVRYVPNVAKRSIWDQCKYHTLTR